MLFNSFEFYLAFLPLTIIGFFLTMGFLPDGRRIGIWFLSLASIAFYAWWNAYFILLILAEIVFSFLIGRQLSRSDLAPTARRALLGFSIALILVVLGYFKYTNFLLGSVSALLGRDFTPFAIILPLGISFHTFQQIAYLVDAYRRQAPRYRFADFCLFVTFFPQLIAGPIVHHYEALPQIAHKNFGRFRSLDLAVGLAIFACGLAKKTLIADNLAPLANGVFAQAQNGAEIGTSAAWMGALAYTLQLYFDFSGYSDMAIGLARIFGIRFPANFDSPYKALTIADFWRRWHITLSRFLRDYLYIPLGGNRRGKARQIGNLLLTMLLGGLWHGAGWTFVIWGALHGLYLALCHLWSEFSPWRLPRPLAWALTLIAVILAWVFFRADRPETAIALIGAMLHPGGGTAGSLADWALIAGSALLALAAPNTQQIFARYRPNLSRPRPYRPFSPHFGRVFEWRPNWVWGLLGGVLTAAGLAAIFGWKSEFLYFQF